MRAFIAIELPHQVQAALHTLQQELAQATTDVKWVEQENLHVTMRFLGDITEEQQQKLESALMRVAAQTPSIQAHVSRLGTFPPKPALRVIWAGVGQGATALERLAESLEREVRAVGIAEEPKPFVAHVTLGRVRFPKPRPQLLERIQQAVWTPPPPCLLTHLTLFHSTLSSAGPTYAALARALLRTA